MKKILIIAIALMASVTYASAQAKIKFDKTTHNFGKFEESEKQHASFTFTNTGNQPLVINQVMASCGCTNVKYEKKPVAPGQSGKIEVTYEGEGKFPGYVKKNITVRSNADGAETVRLYIEGEMD